VEGIAVNSPDTVAERQPSDRGRVRHHADTALVCPGYICEVHRVHVERAVDKIVLEHADVARRVLEILYAAHNVVNRSLRGCHECSGSGWQVRCAGQVGNRKRRAGAISHW